jgi:hypothetical protein
VKVKEYQKYTVEVPKPYEVSLNFKYFISIILITFLCYNKVIKKVPVEVKVPVEKPYEVKVFVPQPYEVIKKVPYTVERKVEVPKPYEVS